MHTGAVERTTVYLESGKKRVFACALEWPGWCRSGKSEDHALAELAAYAERYAAVAQEAGAPFPGTRGNGFEVVERLAGSVTTDFGAPAAIPTSDRQPLTREDAERHAALVQAAWVVLDRVAAGAPAALRKGPRGGGRDRDSVVDHILGAEAAYARKLGVTHRQPSRADTHGIAALRAAILASLRAPADAPPLEPRQWPPRYAARRITWHVLDHAWEIEDRSQPPH